MTIGGRVNAGIWKESFFVGDQKDNFKEMKKPSSYYKLTNDKTSSVSNNVERKQRTRQVIKNCKSSKIAKNFEKFDNCLWSFCWSNS